MTSLDIPDGKRGTVLCHQHPRVEVKVFPLPLEYRKGYHGQLRDPHSFYSYSPVGGGTLRGEVFSPLIPLSLRCYTPIDKSRLYFEVPAQGLFHFPRLRERSKEEFTRPPDPERSLVQRPVRNNGRNKNRRSSPYVVIYQHFRVVPPS